MEIIACRFFGFHRYMTQISYFCYNMIEISYGGKYEENNQSSIDQPDDTGSNQWMRQERFQRFQPGKSHMDIF